MITHLQHTVSPHLLTLHFDYFALKDPGANNAAAADFPLSNERQQHAGFFMDSVIVIRHLKRV